MAALANIRSNINTPFPSTVIGQGPIAIGKANGIWTVNLNINSLGQLTMLPAGSLTLVFNPTTQSWFTAFASLGAQTVRLVSNFSVTNNATPQATNLQVMLNPGNFFVKAYLPITAGTSAGASANISFGGTSPYIISTGWVLSTTSGISNVSQIVGSSPSTISTVSGAGLTMYFELLITVSVGGILRVNFSQNTSNGNASTLLQGASLVVTASQ
jgi:hypothetical protein